MQQSKIPSSNDPLEGRSSSASRNALPVKACSAPPEERGHTEEFAGPDPLPDIRVVVAPPSPVRLERHLELLRRWQTSLTEMQEESEAEGGRYRCASVVLDFEWESDDDFALITGPVEAIETDSHDEANLEPKTARLNAALSATLPAARAYDVATEMVIVFDEEAGHAVYVVPRVRRTFPARRRRAPTQANRRERSA